MKIFIGLFVSLFVSFVSATPIVLDFEGLDDNEAIQNFYNGGTSQNGNSGIDYGVTFSSNTLSLIDSDAGGNGNFGGEPSPDTVMFFLSGSSAIMNVVDGFDIGFSFFYSAVNNAGSVNVFDGINGTGNILASLDIPVTPSDGGDPNGNFSPFYDVGVGFSGTAMSVSFAGVQNQIGFDNVTFGSTSAGVPEPSSVLLLGLALIGIGSLRRKKSI
jgi:hypothetical protein